MQFELNPRIETHGGEPRLKICKNFARPFTRALADEIWGEFRNYLGRRAIQLGRVIGPAMHRMRAGRV